MCPKIPVHLYFSGFEVFRIDRFGVDVFELNQPSWAHNLCEMGFVLIRHSAVDHRRGKNGLRFIVLVCEGETVGQVGEVDEKGERELVLVVSVKCGKE